MLLDEIVAALVRAGARLTGSWARGEEHEHSDFDFRVPERNWKRFVSEAPKGWVSVLPGHVAWRDPSFGQIEASDVFTRIPRGKKLREREALGRVWKTW